MMTESSKTRAWSPAPQESSLRGEKDQKVGAGGANPFGDKPIGDVLNEIADPNWVDPKKVQREQKKDLDKDAFFKLMLTQMKNQDPTNPVPSHEMAAHLAQFTSLEQLFNINANLGDIKKAQSPMADYQVLNFIGKSIAADSSKIVRNKGDKSHELRFDLRGDAANAELLVKDADGGVVRKYNLNALKKGSNKISWNGLNNDSQPARAGDYYFTVEAKNADGKKIAVDTQVKGRISGVNYTSKGPVLMIGDQSIYLADVKQIEDPELKAAEKAKNPEANKAAPAKSGHFIPLQGQPQNQPPSQSPANSSGAVTDAKAEENVPGAPAENEGRGNLDSVAMSQGIKNVLDKVQATNE
jgi:flagellar basal-body rod modification protein FlgD